MACSYLTCSKPVIFTDRTGPETTEQTVYTDEEQEEGMFEDEFDGDYDDEDSLEFDVYVESRWSDLITVTYVPDWIKWYRVTRVWQTGDREFVVEGPHKSRWQTGFELWRGLTPKRQCYEYSVELELITDSKVKSTSEKICVGPGSPASDQLKFWIFTTLVAVIGFSILGAAISHEHQRESMFKRDNRIRFEQDF